MADIQQIEEFCATIFGNGATEGLVAVCRADDAVLTSRNPAEIAEFVGDQEAYVSLQTRRQDGAVWEQPAVALGLDSSDVAPLPPSMVLRNESGDLFGIWLVETVDLGAKKVDRYLTEASPLPGSGGWIIAEEHLDRVYTTEALQEALNAPEQPSQINDMVIHGELDPSLLAREIEIGISPFGAKTMSGRWKNWKTTVGSMLQRFTKHELGEKDGNCFLQGATIDGERRAAAIPSIDLLGLDLDTGENLDEIKAKIKVLGLFAWIYTTHSHLKPITSIKKDEIVKWLGGVENPDLDGVKSYLIEKKRYRPYILEGAKLLDSKHTSDGVCMFIQHQPMPKFRVVFVLKERFVVMDRPGTQSQVLAEWKERYAGTSKALGAYFDRACTDPSRLFYTPRHPKDAKEYRIEVIAGKPLDIDTVDRVTSEELKKSTMSPFEQAASDMSGGKQYKTSSLLWFFGKYGERFDIETFLLEQDPDGDRGPRPRGGRIHRCPNDDAHSDSGNPEDQGFYVVNPDQAENGTATAGCRHDSCSGLDRVDFTDMICERVGITDATELKKWVPATVEDDDVSEEPTQTSDTEEEKPPEHRAYKNVAEARRAIKSISDNDGKAAAEIAVNIGMSTSFGSFDVDSLKRDLIKKSGVGAKVLGDEMNRGKKLAKSEDEEVVLDDETRAELAKWNKRHAIVKMGAKVRILTEANAGEAPDFMEKDSFATYHASDKIMVMQGNERKLAPVFKTWLEWTEVRKYSKVVFEPAGCPDAFYNMWKGLPIKGRRGDWSLLKGHLFDNICLGNLDHYNWLLTWMADIFQNPGEKRGSAIVIKGKKGTGKSFLFDWLRAALLMHALKISDRDAMTNGFNAHMFGLLLMVLEEAFWAGDTAAQGKVKDAITSIQMMLTLKGLDSVPITNYIRFVFVSNEDWIVPAGLEDERRFFVLECGEARRGDVAFFAKAAEQMDNGGLEAMIYDLMNWNPAAVGLTWNSLRKPPQTVWLTGQAQESMPIWERFFYDAIDNATIDDPEKPETVNAIELYEDEPNLIPRGDLKWFFQNYVETTNAGRQKSKDNKLFTELVQDWLLAAPVEIRTANPNGQINADPRPRCFKLPSLREIRDNIAKRKGLSFTVVVDEEEIDVLSSKAA